MPTNGHGADLYPWRNDGPPAPGGDLPPIIVDISSDDEVPEPKLDAKTGALVSELPGGSLRIDFSGAGSGKAKTGAAAHDANLAEHIDAPELERIAHELLDGIDADLQSRLDWIQSTASGIKHLGLKIENPRSPSADADTAVEGQSTVRSPMMLDAVMRFQANAGGELLPAGGPVKVANDTPPKTDQQRLMESTAVTPPDNSDTDAEILEMLMNHYLTTVDRPYYSDTKRMFFKQGFRGSGFKKVYRCPILRRPVSRSVDADDIIVSNDEVSIQECERVTHRIKMRQSVLRRMQLEGQYLDTDVSTPTAPETDPVVAAENEAQGFTINTQRPADYKHTIYETYAELDIDGFGQKDVPGLPLPYRVTLDKDSQKVLEVRRNWKDGDDRYLARIPIVKYTFVEGMGFYGIGLLNIMGNATAAVTTMWRLAIDAGGFASWPGFLYADTVGRQDTMQMRVGLGSGLRINTNGQSIQDAVMGLPYKDVTAGLLQMMSTVAEEGRRVGGTPELMVGEGRQDVPVGTTLAMLDQAVKVVDGVHKGMHISQAEEFALLRDLFREDPDSLLCSAPRTKPVDKVQIIRALENCLLTPAADPNTPSHTIRVMKAVALIQLVTMDPKSWKLPDVYRRVAAMVGMGSIDELLAPPQNGATPPDPKALAELGKLQTQMAELADKAKDRESKENIERMQSIIKILITNAEMADKEQQRISAERIAVISEETERMKIAQTSLIHPEAIGAATAFGANFPQNPPPADMTPPPVIQVPPILNTPPNGRVL